MKTEIVGREEIDGYGRRRRSGKVSRVERGGWREMGEGRGGEEMRASSLLRPIAARENNNT